MSPWEETLGLTHDTLERLYISCLAWEHLGISPEELEEVTGLRVVSASLLRLPPRRPSLRDVVENE